MSKFIVQGGAKLRGEVRINGSKNAAFPAIAASILASGISVIKNVPDITDVHDMLGILKVLGAKIVFRDHVLSIDTKNIRYRPLPAKIFGKLRGSVVMAGAMLSRFGKVSLPKPGGDAIGARPIDVHLSGFKRLGANVKHGRNIEISAKRLRGSHIVLSFTTVTGTENLILASVFASGTTEIRLAATEPHVQNLCLLLRKMGAEISGIGSSSLVIKGVKKLRSATHVLCPDEIETITFAAAVAATRGHAKLTGVDLAALDAPLAVLSRMNVNFATGKNFLEIKPPRGPYVATKIITGVFPQLLTDDQPLLGIIATQSVGETKIHDWIHEGRQGYLKALQKMGAKIEFEDKHRAKIYGPTKLRGAQIRTPDIRAGASIVIAALVAKGRSILYNAEIIDRGYERLDERLSSLGAKIERIE